MKKVFLLLLLFVAGVTVEAQNDTIKNWTVTNNLSLNFSQSYFSNWSAGGENTLATVGKYTVKADYLKGKHKWTNWLSLALGYSLIGNNQAMKTDDKIEFISSYGYEIHDHWYTTMVLTFKSQFAKGYDYKVDSSTYISKFMAPATIDIGPGVEYTPNDHFLLNISPAAGRWIIVNDERLADLGSFGLDPATVNQAGDTIHAKRVKSMFGAKLLMAFNYEIFKNVNFTTKLELFSDYLKNPQNIDVNWQNGLVLKVNSWLNVNITSELIYDNDVIINDDAGNPLGPRTQFNENMMLGIGIKF